MGSAAASLTRPGLANRVPLGRCALGMGYFGLAAYLQLREFQENLRYPPGVNHPPPVLTAYGAYVTLGIALAALLGAAAMRGRALLRRPSVAETIMAALGAGVLVACLLPWLHPEAGYSIELRGVDTTAATLAAFGVWLGANLWRREADLRARLVLALSVSVLVGAAASATGFRGTQAYGAWLGLGFALALAAVAVLAIGGGWRRALPPWRMLATVGPAVLLLVSLFLPWMRYDLSTSHSFSSSGWASLEWGAVAGSLAVVLLALVALRRFETYLPELVTTIAVFVATVGFQIAGLDQMGFGYGAYVGFAAAGLLVAAQLRPARMDRARILLPLLAVAACFAYLAIAVVPHWNVLSLRLDLETPDHTFWLTTAGVLLALHLLASWLRRSTSPSSLVLVPFGLLALVTLELVQTRAEGLGWGGILVVCLCLFLALLGWIRGGGDPRRIPVPEFLRLDRLPGAEAH